MIAKKYIILGVLAFVTMAIGTALSQINTMPPGETIDITKKVLGVDTTYEANDKRPLTVHIYPPNCPSTYDILFYNKNTGDTLRIRNTKWEGSAPLPQQDVLNNTTSLIKYGFCCPTDGGEWRFMIEKKSLGTPSVLVIVIVHCPTPSLSSWGMIILIALIIAAGVYLWMRRKPATA
jgi:hypothetical protein